jgi:hypothetical protein
MENNVNYYLVLSRPAAVWKAAILYRIFTERKNLDGIEKILNQHFKGYTHYKATGFWEGMKEPSIVIEIQGASKKEVSAASKAIKKLNKQQAVLVQEFNLKGTLV